jgi:hypothetical protein
MTATSAPEITSTPGVSRLVTIEGPIAPGDWTEVRAREACRQLEAGNIIFLPSSPVEITSEDRELLLTASNRVPHTTKILLTAR